MTVTLPCYEASSSSSPESLSSSYLLSATASGSEDGGITSCEDNDEDVEAILRRRRRAHRSCHNWWLRSHSQGLGYGVEPVHPREGRLHELHGRERREERRVGRRPGGAPQREPRDGVPREGGHDEWPHEAQRQWRAVKERGDPAGGVRARAVGKERPLSKEDKCSTRNTSGIFYT